MKVRVESIPLIPYRYEFSKLGFSGILFGRDMLDIQKQLKEKFGENCIDDVEIDRLEKLEPLVRHRHYILDRRF